MLLLPDHRTFNKDNTSIFLLYSYYSGPRFTQRVNYLDTFNIDVNYIFRCNKCRKNFKNNVHYFYEGDINKYNRRISYVKCPYCGEIVDIKSIKYFEQEYTMYRDCFLDGNKLKLRVKTIKYNYKYNVKTHSKTYFPISTLKLIIINLDTGIAYLFPDMQNNKIKGGSIKNITYCDLIFLSYDRYTSKCNAPKRFFLKAYSLIREYNMKKFNKYIKTFNEVIAPNIALFHDDCYISLKSNPEDTAFYKKYTNLYILLFNFARYPFVSCFNDYFYQRRYCLKMKNSCPKLYRRLLKLERNIPKTTINPLKDLFVRNNLNLSYEDNFEMLDNKFLAYIYLCSYGLKYNQIKNITSIFKFSERYLFLKRQKYSNTFFNLYFNLESFYSDKTYKSYFENLLNYFISSIDSKRKYDFSKKLSNILYDNCKKNIDWNSIKFTNKYVDNIKHKFIGKYNFSLRTIRQKKRRYVYWVLSNCRFLNNNRFDNPYLYFIFNKNGIILGYILFNNKFDTIEDISLFNRTYLNYTNSIYRDMYKFIINNKLKVHCRIGLDFLFLLFKNEKYFRYMKNDKNYISELNDDFRNFSLTDLLTKGLVYFDFEDENLVVKSILNDEIIHINQTFLANGLPSRINDENVQPIRVETF